MTTTESAFNLDFDLHLLRPSGATLSEYIFCFILFNSILLFAYYNRNRKYTEVFTWILTVVFCVYAFYDTDYFTFGRDYTKGLENFRDPLYYYISKISFGSYTIFRLLIWGIAVVLVYKIFKKFNIQSNIAIFIFATFSLLIFSYARASLGMSLYYYGLTFILFNKNNRPENIIFCILLFILSFWAHRSMALLIIITPVIYISLNKKSMFLIFIIGILALYILNNLFIDLIFSQLDDNTSVGHSANRYKALENEVEMNWKFKLTSYLNKATYIISVIYLGLMFVKQNFRNTCDINIKRLYNIVLFTFIISMIFLLNDMQGLYVIGYRFLYMTGIPICIILAYLYKHKIIKRRTIYWLLICPVLYSESFLAGKILSMSNIL